MAKKQVVSPHDKFFKASLQDVCIARDFFKAYLPSQLQQMMDWHSLELQSGSFIDNDYASAYSDVLYRATFSDQAGYLYILSEHQSRDDPLMPLRLWSYLCKIWERHLVQVRKEQKQAGKRRKKDEPIDLPLIYPLTLYHGKRSPYPHSMDFFDLFAQKELAKKVLLHQPFPLIDLTVMSDDELIKHGYVAAMELLKKHIRQRDLLPTLKALAEQGVFEQIRALGSGNYVIKLLTYVAETGEANSEQVLETLATALSEEEAGIMTIAEQWKQQGKREAMEEARALGEQWKRQGREEGMQQGIQQGMQQGMQQGKLAVARAMQTKGLDNDTILELTGLSMEELTALA